jgi:hypothetical protein
VTYHGGSWLLQTVESNAIGAAVGAIVGGTVSYLYKRAVRLEAVRIERTLQILEHLVGGTTAAIPIIAQKGTMTIQLSQYRKGIAAGVGVMLTGLLTWAESADLEPVLGPLVPEPFRPLVGVFLGGVALTASVILTSNTPKKAASTSPVPRRHRSPCSRDAELERAAARRRPHRRSRPSSRASPPPRRPDGGDERRPAARPADEDVPVTRGARRGSPHRPSPGLSSAVAR